MSHLENYLEKLALENNIELVREYIFHPIRRWRFDFADPKNMIAAETEGGAWSGGRHTRGSGFVKDTEKYNQATVLGWRVLRYCSQKQIKEQFLTDYDQIKKKH